jgi:hypothetical protein
MPKRKRLDRRALALQNPQGYAALYVYGVFDNSDNWTSYQGWLNDIAASGLAFVVFSTFHVDDQGNLFGSVPLVTNGTFNPNGELNPALPSLYQAFFEQGIGLFYSIGNSAGTAGDMAALQTILGNPSGSAYANLRTNLGVLTDTLSIIGIDFDFEPSDYSPEMQTVVTEFTTFCWNLDLDVTYCPYANEQWWIDAQINAVTKSPGYSPLWWNIQCYPDLGNSPEGWLPLIQTNASAMNVLDPEDFVVPGTSTSLTVSQVQAQFSTWAQAMPGLMAGFVWQFGNMIADNSVASYMNAVVQGIESPSSSTT